MRRGLRLVMRGLVGRSSVERYGGGIFDAEVEAGSGPVSEESVMIDSWSCSTVSGGVAAMMARERDSGI